MMRTNERASEDDFELVERTVQRFAVVLKLPPEVNQSAAAISLSLLPNCS